MSDRILLNVPHCSSIVLPLLNIWQMSTHQFCGGFHSYNYSDSSDLLPGCTFPAFKRDSCHEIRLLTASDVISHVVGALMTCHNMFFSSNSKTCCAYLSSHCQVCSGQRCGVGSTRRPVPPGHAECVGIPPEWQHDIILACLFEKCYPTMQTWAQCGKKTKTCFIGPSLFPWWNVSIVDIPRRNQGHS